MATPPMDTPLTDAADGTDVGSVAELHSRGRLVSKVANHGVCVIWHGGRVYAVDDRCPHLGFPLHRGTVEDGLLTCHWHHARFDLCSGGTLDPFADDVRVYSVELRDGRVVVLPPPAADPTPGLLARLDDGLQHGLSLVMAKSVLGLLDAGADPLVVLRRGVAFGTTHRREGWGSGLTVLVAMANLLPYLDPADHPLALVQGLAFLSRDTRGHADFFPLAPLATSDTSSSRLAGWYRRFIDTRNDDAAERSLATAIALGPGSRASIERFVFAAATDHVLVDGGHTVDFTNKAFEALDLLGWEAAPAVLASVVDQTAGAQRSEEGGAWRYPYDLAALARSAEQRLSDVLLDGPGVASDEVEALGWRLLGSGPDDGPQSAVDALFDALHAGATPEQVGRAVAFAASLRITRFHVQNDHGDWDVVHHGFTYASALHQALSRAPSLELLRGAVHGVLKVFLDRFLNVPAARITAFSDPDLGGLQACWDEQGQVDEAGAIVYSFLRADGAPGAVTANLGHALVSEDAEFHWLQTVEAAARQAAAWPDGSEPQALILAGAARFLAAHTPTRRELPQMVRIATRLRRGEDLFLES